MRIVLVSSAASQSKRLVAGDSKYGGEARVNGFVETFVIYSFEKINYTGSCLFRNRLLSCFDLFFFFRTLVICIFCLL